MIWILGLGGWLVSYAYFMMWLNEPGGDFFGGWASAFSTTLWGTGLVWDLVFVTFMVIVVALFERKRLGTKTVVLIIASLSLSVSVAWAIYFTRVWSLKRQDHTS